MVVHLCRTFPAPGFTARRSESQARAGEEVVQQVNGGEEAKPEAEQEEVEEQEEEEVKEEEEEEDDDDDDDDEEEEEEEELEEEELEEEPVLVVNSATGRKYTASQLGQALRDAGGEEVRAGWPVRPRATRQAAQAAAAVLNTPCVDACLCLRCLTAANDLPWLIWLGVVQPEIRPPAPPPFL